MDFDKSIILRVRDRTRSTVSRFNRSLRTTQRITRLQERATRLAERATRRWGRSVDRVQRGFQRLKSRAASFFRSFRTGIRSSIRSVALLAAKLAGIGLATVKAGTFAVANAVSGRISATDREATAAGLERDQFARLLRYLQIASDGQLEREDAKDLVAEFRNRIGEASLEGRGATFDALDAIGRQLGDSGFQQRILQEENVARQMGLVVDALSRLNQNGFDTQFLSEEIFGGTEGRIVNEISNLSQEYIERLNKVLDETGVPISDEDVVNAQNFRLAMAELRGTIQRLLTEVITPLLPGITNTINNISDSIQRFLDNGGGEKISRVMGTINSAIDGAVSSLDLSSIDLDEIIPRVQSAVERIVQIVTDLLNKFLKIIEFFYGQEEGVVLSRNGEVQPEAQAEDLDRAIAQRQAKIDRLRGFNFVQRGIAGLAGNDLEREIELLEEEIRQYREEIQQRQFQDRIDRAEPDPLSPAPGGEGTEFRPSRQDVEELQRYLDGVVEDRADREASLGETADQASLSIGGLSERATLLAAAMDGAIARLNAARPAPAPVQGAGRVGDLGQEAVA